MQKFELVNDLNEILTEPIRLSNSHYEVWFLMKGYNVWHKETECIDFELAYETCKKLERNSECWTEIKYVVKSTTTYRRYKRVEE